MNEKLLQYLWNFKIFKSFDFKDTLGRNIHILDFGKLNKDSGPDFTMARIKIDDVEFVGNIELHVKSSDWIFHNHQQNSEFNNLILHVVFEDDVDITELKSKNVPTLELRPYIDSHLLSKYALLQTSYDFIPCENIFTPKAVHVQFSESNLLKKLNDKSAEIDEQLNKFGNNYEAVLFHLLAYGFGLKVNAQIFKSIAEQIDFGIVQKIRTNGLQLESLLYGQAGWLEQVYDDDSKIFQREYEFLRTKFKVKTPVFTPKFMRLRPPNFPTIRLSQLAHLYHREQHLFSKIIESRSIEEIRTVFSGIVASKYWNNRYVFGKTSDQDFEKAISSDFIDLLLINVVLPMKYTYHKNHDEHIAEDTVSLYHALSAEKNTLITSFKKIGATINNACDSQAYLYQYKNFCVFKNCLNCSIGLQILKNTL